MTDKQDASDWRAKTNLDDTGFDVRPPAVRLDARDETPKHLILKSLVARAIQRRGRGWDTEVKGPDGRVDVIDFGDPDEQPVAYEIQTNATPKEKSAKVDQYVRGTALRDVIFLDPTDAPDSIPELVDWVDDRMVG